MCLLRAALYCKIHKYALTSFFENGSLKAAFTRLLVDENPAASLIVPASDPGRLHVRWIHRSFVASFVAATAAAASTDDVLEKFSNEAHCDLMTVLCLK